MKVQEAVAADAEAMSEILQEIVANTGRQLHTEPYFIISNYINHSESVQCTAAVDEQDKSIGF